ncbi:MAG: glycosyltransferase [Thaumarchaeota archaeon]|nr:glycosyltransferase [Nitrososphaerota archaeon]
MKGIIISASALFLILAAVAVLMLSPVTLVALLIAFVLGGYLLSLEAYRRFPDRSGRHLPSLLLLAFALSPFVFLTLIILQGVLTWQAGVLAIISYGLMVTFWVNLLSVPLAIKSKYEEGKLVGKRSFPSLSIIVPAHNEEMVLGQTLESVLEADYPNKQVIVVDDGSTDGTFHVAARYGDRVVVLQKENGGKSSALNYGLKVAAGEIIAVVDADTMIGRDSLTEIAQKFADEKVVAVAGNVKVANRKGWLANCQALEYVISIQTIRRALDRFGTVTVVPGALGAFRRRILDETGDYDGDTLTEDFDATIKALKSGSVVQGSSQALAYTQAPRSFKDLYNQRLRWYRGNFQTFRKHLDVITNPRYGNLYGLGFPFMLLSMVVVPVIGLIVWGSVIVALAQGQVMFILEIVILFIALQSVLALTSILIDGEDPKLILYAPFFVIGYKQLLDIFTVKALVDVFLRRGLTWTRAQRF